MPVETIDPARILARHSASIPRYTSYPTAPHFKADMGQELAGRMLSGIGRDDRISVYLHVPFCDRLCWFCGCHTKHTLKYGPVAAYVQTLCREIRQTGERIGFRALLGHVHFGGGSPSMLQEEDLARLREALENAFIIDEVTEISVEIDPSDVSETTISGLKRLGLTRASIGVQDFHPQVQAAINRPQSFEQTRDVVAALREAGVGSLNIDALYGLPLQTLERVEQTIDQVASLQPDRVALFGYAHVPWLKKHQQMIRDEDLPDVMERFRQAERAAALLVLHGYRRIGFDHFARPTDSMAIAAQDGSLRRNFQGYTTDNCSTLIGMGASSISSFQGGFVQNIVATAQYREAVEKGESAAARGLALTEDDMIRGWMIERLMCDFAIDKAALVNRFGLRSGPYLDEIDQVVELESEGLCRMENDRLVVPDAARPFVRIVAARFDAYLENTEFRYSRAV